MKKVLSILLGLLMIFGLTACSSNQVEENQSAAQINEHLKNYYGTYVAAIDANDIVINNQGISYGGKLLSISGISEDHYVKLKDSDVIFILDIGMVMTNIANPKEAAQLITYDITNPNINTEVDEKEILINDKLKTYVGKYQSDTSRDSFEFVDPYQLTNIDVDNTIYYVDGKKTNQFDKSSVFNDTDVMVEVDGALIVNLETVDGCRLNAVFGVNDTIYLTIQKDSQVYTSLFKKIK